MDDPTRPVEEQLQVNGSIPSYSRSRPSLSPSPIVVQPTSFHWEQYFFSRVPSQGLYLTRSKSFPYYLLAIALSLFQTSSSGFVLLDRVFGLFILLPPSPPCLPAPALFHLSLRFPPSLYLLGDHPNPIHCRAFALRATYFGASFHISSSIFVYRSNIYISLGNIIKLQYYVEFYFYICILKSNIWEISRYISH